MGGDLDLFRGLAEYFFLDAPPLVDRIQAALARGDADQVERAAHSVKGLAANFGADFVVSSAARLEDLGKRAELDGNGATALADLRTHLDSLFQHLKEYRRPLTDKEASA
jgi:HPt (histidine-containing phosphotransfer) domain-containing protein